MTDLSAQWHSPHSWSNCFLLERAVQGVHCILSIRAHTLTCAHQPTIHIECQSDNGNTNLASHSLLEHSVWLIFLMFTLEQDFTCNQMMLVWLVTQRNHLQLNVEPTDEPRWIARGLVGFSIKGLQCLNLWLSGTFWEIKNVNGSILKYYGVI